MGELNFTKGEWRAVKSPMGDWVIEMEGILICREVRHYNAHLIASAPKLLKACEDALNMLDAIDHIYPTPKTQAVLKQAIAEAKGQTE